MTVAIAYNAGSYGTYLEWCLTTMCSTNPITKPFNSNGNSHVFKGNFVPMIDLLSNSRSVDFVRFHPKTSKDHSLSANLDRVCDMFDSVIYLYPGKSSMLLSVNNSYHKVWTDWWKIRLNDKSFADNLYSNWPIQPGTAVEDIPNWILRELLSFYLMPSWFDEVEWYHPDRWSNQKCITVCVDDLLDNFSDVIDRVQKFCNLNYKRSIHSMIPYHEEMLSLQKFTSDDTLCNQIVNSVLTNTVFDWKPDLSLPSQSWIQWQLRNQGFEIQCQGLDTFPTNSLKLRELLYST